MTDQITRELARLERQHDIKILYAVESGSRAWGFASTDSDWDVRYLYVHSLDWYLMIDDKKDSREDMLPNDLDLAGWELKKALRLFRKSNPPLLEWLHSPTVYSENYATAGRMRELMKQYFNPKSCLHHYLHMAERNYRAYLLGERVKVKKYFYVLRPLLACDWIKETDTMAPMEFRTLLDRQVHDPAVKDEIENLLARKIAGEELSEEPKIKILNDFLEEKIARFNEHVRKLPRRQPPATGLLNDLFKESLQEAWDGSIPGFQPGLKR